jgi:uncharacterized protein (TIGR03083 family)
VDVNGVEPEDAAVFAEVLDRWDDRIAQAPPAGLRDGVIALARSRRPRGASLLEVGELSSVEAYAGTIELLGGLLDQLAPSDWDVPTIEGWSVKGLVSHLIAIEKYFGRQLGLWLFDVDPDLEHDHLGMTRAFVESWRDRSGDEVLARWRALTTTTTRHLQSLERAAFRLPFHFHYLDTTLSTVLIARVFEIWTHDEDIRRATGRVIVAPDGARLRRMSRVAVASMPFGLAFGGAPVAGRTARIVLTGPGGGTWDQALGLGETAGEPDTTLVLDVVDYCRLAARRLTAGDVAVTVEGDAELARLVLAGAGVFAA